jgi:hypothetical protein
VVFVAPEYLFAKDGYRHLLDYAETHDIQSRLASISRNAPHVLMFPGTVSFRQPITGQSVRARVHLYEDIGFWKRQGLAPNSLSTNRDKIRHIAMRGENYDMAANKSYAFLNGKLLMEYTKRGDFHEVTAQDHTGQEAYVPGKEAGGLHAFGKTFGVEICLDHNMGYSVRGGGKPQDVHVIMSASVTPVATHENTVGTQPGKVGFVVHASSSEDYTQVVRWADGLRSELKPMWSEAQTHGMLYGYKLDFSTTQDTGDVRGVQGKVAAIKSMFGG